MVSLQKSKPSSEKIEWLSFKALNFGIQPRESKSESIAKYSHLEQKIAQVLPWIGASCDKFHTRFDGIVFGFWRSV